MSVLLRISLTFMKIGILTFGGGLAMIPVVQQEMLRHGWLSHDQFLDIVGIAEMTPGPLAVNMATYAGYSVSAKSWPGVWWLILLGALVGTISVCFPSLVCINLLGGYWQRNRNHPCMVKVFEVLRPVIAGMIIAVAAGLVVHCVTPSELQSSWISGVGALIAAAAFGWTVLTRWSPVWLLIGGVIIGMLVA